MSLYNQRPQMPPRIITYRLSQHDAGGYAACTTVALVAALYLMHRTPERFDGDVAVDKAAHIWRAYTQRMHGLAARQVAEVQAAHEVVRHTPALAELVCVLEDGEIHGYTSDAAAAGADPAFGVHTIRRAVAALERAAAALERSAPAHAAVAAPETQRPGARHAESARARVGAGVFTCGGHSVAVCVELDARGGPRYGLFDAYSRARLWLYARRDEFVDGLRRQAGAAPEFSLSLLGVPAARRAIARPDPV